jgi:hypothetical protein
VQVKRLQAIFIFDEAHHLNTKALSHFSLSTNTEFIKSSLRQDDFFKMMNLFRVWVIKVLSCVLILAIPLSICPWLQHLINIVELFLSFLRTDDDAKKSPYSRWQSSGLSALIVMERETVEVAKQKTTPLSFKSSRTTGISLDLSPDCRACATTSRVGWSIASIHRYICNRANWLYEITQTQKIKPISRAHLPRFLNGLDWSV